MMRDIIIKYPANISEMLVPAGATITTLDRRINGKLRSIAVSIPENGIMEIKNNNITSLFFSNEAGCVELPHGVEYEDMVITVANTGTDAARFNYLLVFEMDA
ncbi:hypothetical protein J6C36_05130 [Methanocorpusculaceae archaeon]|nr:hypothetical protein [Methanocorpusculaceae archaeon]MBO5119757.1 hypothetical protein [Methanocorpusculum sp.]MBO5368443.1 hypothetical protein [Methanocorpusculum sp.]MBO5430689.1 hypothetical protein [Methanocorpusculum sp.]MBP3443090.1 hypothetical protein [Methanocorpusculaceae archaeon]